MPFLVPVYEKKGWGSKAYIKPRLDWAQGLAPMLWTTLKSRWLITMFISRINSWSVVVLFCYLSFRNQATRTICTHNSAHLMAEKKDTADHELLLRLLVRTGTHRFLPHLTGKSTSRGHSWIQQGRHVESSPRWEAMVYFWTLDSVPFCSVQFFCTSILMPVSHCLHYC